MMSHKQQKMDDILICFICLSHLQNPHICPCCSKLCCYQCITKWLTENRQQQCPHCRSALRIQQLVNCRFLEELVQTNDPCPQHNAQLQYYCITCSEPICSECAMFSNHKQHEYEHIQKVFDSKVKIVKTNIEIVNDKLKVLKDNAATVDDLVDELNRSKDERVQEIQALTESLLSKLEQSHQQRLMVLFSQKQNITNKILSVSSELDDVTFQIKKLQKSETILIADELLGKVIAIDAEPEQIGGVSMDFPSEITPHYIADTYELRNFNQQEEIVYSDHMIHNGIKWRLKIYPHGNGNAKNVYISIFLEMDSKQTDARRYEYKIEMFNQRNGAPVIREFSSEFEGGECWGYNRFFRIDLLAKDGYLKDDKLIFKYFVRAPNYYTECLDMQRHIQQLEAQVSQQLTVRKNDRNEQQHSSIQKLKEEIEQYAEKIGQLEQSSGSDEEDDEEEEESHSNSQTSECFFDGQFEEIPQQQETYVEQPVVRRNLIKRFNQQLTYQSSNNKSSGNRSPLSELNDNLYI